MKVPEAMPALVHKVNTLGRCDVCGNDYDGAFQVIMEGKTRTFDSFECAIHACAPACAHCNCKIIGHGVQAGQQLFCCAHCAKHAGHTELRDRL